MILKIHTKRIIRICFVFFVLVVYTCLLIWSTSRIMAQVKPTKELANQKLSPETDRTNIHKQHKHVEKQQKVVSLGQIRRKGESEKKCRAQPGQLADKRWLMARYDPEVEIQWTEANLKIDSETLVWWQGTSEIDSLSTVKKLFGLGVPKRNVLRRSEADVLEDCRKCAVIGNHSKLKGTNFGKVIDSHDFVMRTGRVFRGHEDSDIGLKTTHQFIHPETTEIFMPEGITAVFIPLKPLDVEWLANSLTSKETQHISMPNIKQLEWDTSKILIINPNFIRYTHSRWLHSLGQYPSEKFIAVVFAIHVCDKINVFGMDYDQNTMEEKSKDNVEMATNKKNDITAENAELWQLNNHQFIHIHEKY